MRTQLLKIFFKTGSVILLFLLSNLVSIQKTAAEDFWEKTSGPYGASVNALVIDQNGYIFAGANAGLFRSIDNGASWAEVNTGIEHPIIYALAINSSGHIFAGGILSFLNYLIRSTDAGNTWTAVTLSDVVTALAINSSGQILAGTSKNGVFRSTNNGDSWTAVNSGLPSNVSIETIIINSSGTIFLGTNVHGIFRSTNNGNSWTAINNGLPKYNEQNFTVVHTLVIKSSSLDIFAGTNHGVYRLSNNSNTWIKASSGFSGFVRALAINSNGYVFAGTSSGVFCSQDNGGNWAEVDDGLPVTYVATFLVQSLAINSKNDVFAGTCGTGIYRLSNNETSWTEVNTGLSNALVDVLAINENDQIFAASSNGIYRSNDDGKIWSKITTGLTNYFVSSLAINSDGYIFAGTSGSGIFLSKENGNKWAQINDGLTDLTVLSLVINASKEIFAGTQHGIFLSTNNGTNWRSISSGLPLNAWIYALAINKSSGHIFAGTWTNGIYRSTDNGNNWSKANSGIPDNILSAGVSTIAINLSGNIFAALPHGQGGVFRSMDNGDNWAQVNQGLDTRVVILVINAVGHIFAGTQGGGIFRSTNNGSNWTAINSGLSNKSIESLAINSKGRIFAGTNGSGVFKSAKSTQAPVAITDAAASVSTNSATLKGSVNPNGLETNVVFKYGETSSYSKEVSTGSLNGTTSIAVSAYLTGLSPKTVYHYGVFATNIEETFGGDKSFTTLGNTPTVTTDAATNISTNSATLNGKVNANYLSTTVKFQYGPDQNYGSEVPLTLISVTGSTPVPVSAELTNLSPNSIYHFRVVATNELGTTYGSDRTFTTQLPAYSTTLMLNTVIDFPSLPRAGDYRDIDYQLVGLPGGSDSSVTRFLPGTHKKDWQVYWDKWDDSKAANVFVEYNGGAEFSFKVGRAFWIIKKGPLDLTNRMVPSAQLVPPTPLNEAQFKIPLHRGWNLITNPYTISVAWSKIKEANSSVDQPIWKFNQSFSLSDSLKPYIGYYFDNRQNLDALKIPYSLYYPSSLSGAVAAESNFLWEVNIALSSGDFIEKTTSFGISCDASQKLDDLDFRKPRSVPNIPSVFFNHADWVEYDGIFATDIRPEFEKMETWDFEVSGLHQLNSKLDFKGIEQIPEPMQIYLVDEGRGKSINLREQPSYDFMGIGDIMKFQVVVGKSEAVEEKLSEINIPKKFALGNNYPNPFNPETTIPVEIPVASVIELKVYNILGQNVRSLFEGQLEAGRYIFTWDGHDETGSRLSSGVYILHLNTNTRIILTHKMILIR